GPRRGARTRPRAGAGSSACRRTSGGGPPSRPGRTRVATSRGGSGDSAASWASQRQRDEPARPPSERLPLAVRRGAEAVENGDTRKADHRHAQAERSGDGADQRRADEEPEVRDGRDGGDSGAAILCAPATAGGAEGGRRGDRDADPGEREARERRTEGRGAGGEQQA